MEKKKDLKMKPLHTGYISDCFFFWSRAETRLNVFAQAACWKKGDEPGVKCTLAGLPCLHAGEQWATSVPVT